MRAMRVPDTIDELAEADGETVRRVLPHLPFEEVLGPPDDSGKDTVRRCELLARAVIAMVRAGGGTDMRYEGCETASTEHPSDSELTFSNPPTTETIVIMVREDAWPTVRVFSQQGYVDVPLTRLALFFKGLEELGRW